MNVALWAEIRRLAEIEKLSGRAISRRLRCSRHTVTAALELDQPPGREVPRRTSLLDAYQVKIDALLAKYPDLSSVRIHEEIARGPDGYTGSTSVVRRYLRKVRPARGRVYQEVHYEPAKRCRSIGVSAAACKSAPRPARFRCSWRCSATAG